MKKTKILLVAILLLVNIFSIQPVSAYSKEYDPDTKTISIVNATGTLITIQQISHTPSLTTCTEVFNITSYIDYTLDVEKDFKIRWNKYLGRNNIINADWFLLQNQTYNVTVNDYGYVQQNQTIYNITSYENITDTWKEGDRLDIGSTYSIQKWNVSINDGTTFLIVGLDDYTVVGTNPLAVKIYYDSLEIVGTHQEIRYKGEWYEFNPLGKTLHADRSYIVKLVFYKEAELGNFSIQTVPMFAGIETPELTWWNGSYTYRAQTNTSSIHFPQVMSVNVSSESGENNETWIFTNGHNITNFDDIRFVLNDTTELNFWIEDNTTNVIEVFVNVTANGTVGMYYGYALAEPASNGYTTFQYFEDFSDGDYDGWTVESGTWTAEIVDGRPAISTTGNDVRITSPAFSAWTSWEATFSFYVPTLNGGIDGPFENTGKTDGIIPLIGTGAVSANDDFDLRKYHYASIIESTWDPETEWNDYTVVRHSNDYEIFLNGSSMGSGTNTSSWLFEQIGLKTGWSSTAHSWTNIRVHNVTSDPPQWDAWGAEEEPPGTYTPPAPTDMITEVGVWWINYSWSVGVGDITDSYNVSIINSTGENWYNGTTDLCFNVTNTTLGEWVNITVYAFNTTGIGGVGTLSETSLTEETFIDHFFVDPSPYDGEENVVNDPTTFIIKVYTTDLVDVSFINNETQTSFGTDTNVANDTSATINAYLWGGTTYEWYAQMDADGTLINSSVFTFSTVGSILFFEENDPSTRITTNVSVTMYNSTNAWNTTAIEGNLNITSLVDDGLLVLGDEVGLIFSADGFYQRQLVIPEGLGDIWRFYLLNESTSAVSNEFSILDYTGGDFSTSDVMVIFKRYLDGEERYIAGGYRGVSNNIGAILQLGSVYNVFVVNNEETRGIGNYYATSSGSKELVVGLVQYPTEIYVPFENISWNVTTYISHYDNGTIETAYIHFTYNDSQNESDWLNVTIYDADDLSTIFYSTNITTNTSLVSIFYYPSTADLENGTIYLLNITNTLGSALVRIDFRAGIQKIQTLAFFEEYPEYQWLFSGFIILFTAMLFPVRFSDIGCFVVGAMGVFLWQVGFLPSNALTLSTLVLVFIIAGLNAVWFKKRTGEI